MTHHVLLIKEKYYSLRSFLTVTFRENFCFYLSVTFKVKCNIKCCFYQYYPYIFIAEKETY